LDEVSGGSAAQPVLKLIAGAESSVKMSLIHESRYRPTIGSDGLVRILEHQAIDRSVVAPSA